jgi:predicted nucleic acid-binding protein
MYLLDTNVCIQFLKEFNRVEGLTVEDWQE